LIVLRQVRCFDQIFSPDATFIYQSHEDGHPGLSGIGGGSLANRRPGRLVEMLQPVNVIEPETSENQLGQIEQNLLAEPFVPFLIEMLGKNELSQRF
jgi:hypothetical protein